MVGVILNLSVWFALHVLFGGVTQGRLGPQVDPTSLIPANLALTVIAGLLLLVFRLPLIPVLALMAALSGGVSFLI